ncbi:RNHCP domain-containing protein [bacterium]|nr:RNHCP domain-containing protein [bacterium]
MAFQRTKEDFVCEKCGTAVTGTGYTNHCPNCLWSKHVDIDPGDRLEACQGMMEPIRMEGATARLRIVHHCTKCGFERYNDIAQTDSPDAVISVSGYHAQKK